MRNKNSEGSSAPMLSAASGQGKYIDLLTKTAANVNEINANGNTALHEASFRGHMDCVNSTSSSRELM